MSASVMTLARLADHMTVDNCVGRRPDRRWGRGCLTTRRSDGVSIAAWFEGQGPEERIALVRQALLEATPWSPLLRVQIPKPGSLQTRSIDMPTVADAARLYILHDWLSVHAETVLTKVAMAFRTGVRMDTVIKNARRRMETLPFASVIDISAFYDNIRWGLLDGVIRVLPADDSVQGLLEGLVRVAVLDRRSGSLVARTTGIPQGLSCSPVLANLSMGEFDRNTAHTLSKLGVVIRRYCDDLLLLAPSADALGRAIRIVGDRLANLGLSMKHGTGQLVDTRQAPVEWLGISFGPEGLDVPAVTIDRKAAELQNELDRGIISPSGIEDSLEGLRDHYRRIVPRERAEEVVACIRNKLDISTSPNSRKEDIERLQELVTGRVDRGSTHSGLISGSQPDDRTTTSDRYDGGVPANGVTTRTHQLARLAAPRFSSSGAWETGAPARSAPVLLENLSSSWRLGAIARGPRHALVVMRQEGLPPKRWVLAAPESESCPETALLGLLEGLRHARAHGATHVTVVVADMTLAGYLWHGWRPASLRMHQTLRHFLQAAEGAITRFEPARSPKPRGQSELPGPPAKVADLR